VQRRGGIDGLCAVLIRLLLPNSEPAVELVIGQPQYGQLSVTSLLYIRQRD